MHGAGHHEVCGVAARRTARFAGLRRARSGGRRNILMIEVLQMVRPRVSLQRRRVFWRLVAEGCAAWRGRSAGGVASGTGEAWFSEAGGMAPIRLSEPSGRCLYRPSVRRSPWVWRGATSVGDRGGVGAVGLDGVSGGRPQPGAPRQGLPGGLGAAGRTPGGPTQAEQAGRQPVAAGPGPGRPQTEMEPAADLPGSAPALPEPTGDVGVPREHLSGPVRPGPRRAAPRTGPVPAHRAGAAPAPQTHPGRDPGQDRGNGDDQRPPGRGGRPGPFPATGRAT